MSYVPSFDAVFAAVVARFVSPEAVRLWEPADAREVAALAYKAAVLIDAVVAQEAIRWAVPGGWVAEELRKSAEKLGLDLVPLEVARAYWEAARSGKRVVLSLEEGAPEGHPAEPAHHVEGTSRNPNGVQEVAGAPAEPR